MNLSKIFFAMENEKQIEQMFCYWRIRVFITLHLGYCMFYVTRKNLVSVLHIFSENLHIDIVNLGIITGVFSMVYGVGKIFTGLLADKYSPRILMAGGLFLSGIINLIFGFLTSLWLLVIFWGLNGLFQSAGYPPVAKSLASWFSPQERAKIWSWWNSSHLVGTFMAGGLVTLLLASKDWHAVFYVPGIIGIIAAGFIFWGLRDSPETIGLSPLENAIKDGYSNASPKVHSQNHWFILKKYVLCNPYIWFVCLSMCCLQMVRFSTLDWATKFLYEARGIDKTSVIWLWNLASLAGVPGGLVAGYMASRFFKGCCCWMSLGYLVALGLNLYGYIVLAGAAHFGLTFVFLASIVFLVDGLMMLLAVLIANLATNQTVGTVAGFGGGIGYFLGAAIGANFLAVGIVSAYGWSTLYYICIGCIILSVILISLCIKKEKTSFL